MTKIFTVVIVVMLVAGISPRTDANPGATNAQGGQHEHNPKSPDNHPQAAPQTTSRGNSGGVMREIGITIIGGTISTIIGGFFCGMLLYKRYQIMDEARYHPKNSSWQKTPSGVWYSNANWQFDPDDGNFWLKTFGISEIVQKAISGQKLSPEEEIESGRPKEIRLPPITVDIPISLVPTPFQVVNQTLNVRDEKVLDLPPEIPNLTGEWQVILSETNKSPEGYIRYEVVLTQAVNEDFWRRYRDSNP